MKYSISENGEVYLRAADVVDWLKKVKNAIDEEEYINPYNEGGSKALGAVVRGLNDIRAKYAELELKKRIDNSYGYLS